MNAQHRYRAQNRRAPLKRSKLSPMGSPDALDEQQAACYGVVTKATGSVGPQSSDPPQCLTPDAKALEDFRTVDRIIQRERLLSTGEVAEILGVSVGTLKSWRGNACRRGKAYKLDLPFVRFRAGRGLVKYRLRDLQDWLDKLGMNKKPCTERKEACQELNVDA